MVGVRYVPQAHDRLVRLVQAKRLPASRCCYLKRPVRLVVAAMTELTSIPLAIKYGTIVLAVTLACLVAVWIFHGRKKKG